MPHFSSQRWLSLTVSIICALMTSAHALADAVPLFGQGRASEMPLFRLFLRDGTPIATWGEFARTDGRVVFTLPIGSIDAPASLQIVSLPDHVIDWERTGRYADTVRYERYAETRGEADYEALTADVARALTEMAVTADPDAKLAVAREVRARLADWPRSHFGYRSADVRELVQLIDEAVSAVRADLGEQTFAIELVAVTQPPSEQLLPAPTLQDSVDLAMTVARMADVPAERMSLRQAILSALAPRDSGLPSSWVKNRRREVQAALRADQRVEMRYTELVQSSLEDAAARARRADVDGVSRVLEEVRSRDAKLGRSRPGQMAALLATIESHLRSARQLRLEWDRYELRLDQFGAYRRDTSKVVSRMRDLEPDMEAIRALSGPDLKRLRRMTDQLAEAEVVLGRLEAPPDLSSGHEALSASLRLMREAARLRLQAVAGADLQTANNASAAAAGAQLLLSRARAEIDGYFQRPQRQ